MPRFDDGAIDMQELLRRLAEQVVNAVMDAEADQLCGGGAKSRNGYRERPFATCVGTLTLRIPKLRSGSFFPRGLARAQPACRPRPRRCRRRDVRHGHEHPQGAEGGREDGRLQALEGPGERHRLEPGHRHRGSVRKAARRLAGALRLARRDLRQVPARVARRLHRRGHRHRLRCGRRRRVPGVDVVDTESYDLWLAFLRAICSRGAAGVRIVVSDAHPGLVRALGEVFQGAAWQRCAVHLMRGCMREAGSWQLRRRVGRIVSRVFRGRDAATVTAMYHAACDMLEGCCPRAAAVLEEAEPNALAYLDFPSTHWKHLRVNNVQEGTNLEIKRRSRVVQVFPPQGRGGIGYQPYSRSQDAGPTRFGSGATPTFSTLPVGAMSGRIRINNIYQGTSFLLRIIRGKNLPAGRKTNPCSR